MRERTEDHDSGRDHDLSSVVARRPSDSADFGSCMPDLASLGNVWGVDDV
jgi:hypothetical protein